MFKDYGVKSFVGQRARESGHEKKDSVVLPKTGIQAEKKRTARRTAEDI